MNTVPGMLAISCAVSWLPRVAQSPMSPAPTSTADMDGAGGAGDVDDDPEQAADRSAASTNPPARFIRVAAPIMTRHLTCGLL